MIKRFKTATRRAALMTILYFGATAIAGASFWPSGGHWGDSAVGRVLTRVAPAFGLGGGTPPPAPSVAALMTATVSTDTDSDGKADPGDVIRYSTTITNSGTDATGVNFTALADAHTTLSGTVKVSPLAINESYTSVGNMTLTSSSIGSDCSTPLRSVTCNDTLNGATLTRFGDTQLNAGNVVVNGSNIVTTINAGAVTLSTNGTFVYNPAAGFEGNDEFWYTLTNTTTTPNLTDTGKVTITVGGANGMVWFVNSTGGVGTGRQSAPFNSLAAITAVNDGVGTNPANGDTIYLLENAAPHNGQLVLRDGQRLLSQDIINVQAMVATLGGPAPQPGNAYTLNSAGSVSLTSAIPGAPTIQLGSGNTLAGFTVGHTNGAFAISGTVAGTVSVRQVAINSAGGGGLGIAASASFTNDATFTGFNSITATGGTNGILLGGLTGTFTVNTGALSGATGSEFVVSGGSAVITFNGTITHNTAGQRAISISNTLGGSVTLNNGGPNAYVSGGTGILLDGVAGTFFITGADLNGSKGIEILGDSGNVASGTYTINNTTIDTTAGASNHAFIVDGDQGGNNNVIAAVNLNNVDITNPGGLVASIQGMGGGSITFDSSSAIVRNNGGLGISASSNGGGTVSFNGTSKTLTTNTNAAVSLTNNPGTTFTFANGGLAITTTTTAAGFSATGGGTVNVTGSNNTINSTSGTALNVANTTIGASGLTFQSVSSNGSGATAGVILDATGSAGGLTVTGTGGTCTSALTCTGGTIASKTGGDILSGSNATGQATSGTGGTGIFLRSTSNPSFSNMQLNDFSNFAVYGNNVTGFSLTNSNVTGSNGDQNAGDREESALRFDNLKTSVAFPNATITNNTIAGGGDGNILVYVTSGTLDRINVSNNTFGLIGSGGLLNLAGDNVQMTAYNSATLKITLNNNVFNGTRGDFFEALSNNNTILDVVARENKFLDGQAIIPGGGTAISIRSGSGGFSSTATTTFDISCNRLNAGDANAYDTVAIFAAKGQDLGTMTGSIVNNVVGPAKTNANADGIFVRAAGAGTATVLIQDNTLSGYGNAGIHLQNNDGSSTLNATVFGNGESNANSQNFAGLFADNGATATDTSTMNLVLGSANIGGQQNTLVDGVNGAVDVSLSNFNASTHFNLFKNGSPSSTVTGVVQDDNIGSPTVDTTGGSGPITLVTSGLPSAPPAVAGCATIASLAPMPADVVVAGVLGEASTGSGRLASGGLSTTPHVPLVAVLRALSVGSNAPTSLQEQAAFSRVGSLRVALSAFGSRIRGLATETLAGLGLAREYTSRLARQAANNLVATLDASGETVIADIGALPAGKSITVVFSVNVDTPPVASYSTHATISSTTASFSDVDSNTVTTNGDRYNSSNTLVSSPNPSDELSPVTFTATVQAIEGPGTPTPDGNVQFMNGAAPLGSPAVCNPKPGFVSQCTATLITSSLPVGSNSITANYLGGVNYDPSTSSNSISQVVNACTVNPVVTTNADSGAGSLRQAIADACGASGTNLITFNMGSVVSPITLTSGELAPTRDVVITGPGAKALTIIRDAGAGAFRIFHVGAGRSFAISRVTVSNGFANAGGLGSYGGGLYSEANSSVTITAAAFTGNTAGDGAGVAVRTATLASSLTIVDSTFSGNTASSTGGGVLAESAPGAGVGVSTLTMTNTTISGNVSAIGGGGINLSGTAIGTITNSTIAGNSVTNNGIRGGGIRVSATGSALLRNTIVANNTEGSGGSLVPSDVVGALDGTSANSLVGNASFMTGVTNGTNGNLVGVDPLLGPLADNGGPTQTQALLSGSPALDAGDNTFVVGPTDQRGAGFARILDSADAGPVRTVDIGALEQHPVVEDITDKVTNEDTPLAFSFNVGDAIVGFDSISASSSNTILAPNTGLVITGIGSTRTLTITPAPNQNGTSTITVTATRTVAGSLQTASDTFLLTVIPQPDTPSVTGATTFVNLQTSSGLVIIRNAVDGAEVTHFKITGITNGTLFQHDGTTPIVDNDFITFAQGIAGLRFTPTSGQTATGSFQVQASLDALATGLSGAATAIITVNKHATTTTIDTHAPDPSERSQGIVVTFTVASADGGPAPTGNVTVSISGGTETCTATVAAGQCTISPATPGAGQTLTATYAGDALNNGSSGTATQTVLPCPALPIVTSVADSGPGSLRQAIADACSTDSITFNIAGAGPHTITLTTGMLAITKNLAITGSSDGVRISGNHTSSIVDVDSASTVTLSTLTLFDGFTSGGGGAVANHGTLTIANSTLSGNESMGGGAVVNEGSLIVLNSTISGNTAPAGAGIFHVGTTLSLVNATVTANTATASAGGLFNFGTGSSAINTILTGNTSPDNLDVGGPEALTDGGHNLLTGSPLLGPLQDNGGPTFTHAPLQNSPALDAGDNAAATTAGLTTDQRGVQRVVDSSDADAIATVDIGAVEVQSSIAAIGPQSVAEDGSVPVTITIGDPSVVTSITATSGTPAIVPNNPANLTFTGSGSTRTLTVTPGPDAFGLVTITVSVTSGTEVSSTSFTLSVSPVADTPSVTNASTQEDTATSSGLVVTRNSIDGVEVSHVRITAIANGTLFKHDGTTPIAVNGVITFAEASAGLVFKPAADFFGTGTVTLQGATDVSGAGAGATITALIAVAAVADTPSITNATTVVNAQTTSGLVITRNAADGAEVTHFQITNVTGGALFLNDGVTAIPAGAFITAAQGAAGLRFTPAPNSAATGHFTVQASVSNSAGGLGGGTVTADITVNPLPSTTTVVTSASPVNPGQTVTFTATVTPAGAGATGTVQFMDGATAIGSPVSLVSGTAAFSTTSLAPGLHTIAAVYSGTALYQTSTGTLSGGQTVRAIATVVVSSSANPSSLGDAVTIQATPTGAGGTATGTITFREGSGTLATASLTAGTATFTTSAFTLGTHHLVVDYAGDAAFAPGTATFDQIVSCPVMTLSPASLPPAIIAVAYSQTFTQTGGPGTITFALTGALPAGITFNAATATLSGVSQTPGSYPVQVTATSSNGCSTVTATDTLVIGGGRTVLVGADAGSGPQARRFSALDGSAPTSGPGSLLAFDGAFTGGVRVAEGDVNGDGTLDFITGAGPGGGPNVRVFDGATGALQWSFAAFEPEFQGGVFVAAGDVNGDGVADVIVGSGEGRSGEIKVFSGRDHSVLKDFFVFARGFTGGVRVAAGDVNGDGLADIVAGAGPGGSQVQVFNATDLSVVRTLTPYAGFTGGVWVAAGDVTGDGFADVVTGAGAGGGPHVRVFDGRTGADALGLFAYAPTFSGGVRVAVGDVTGDGHADIITGAGPGGQPQVRVFDGATAGLISDFLAYPSTFTGGVFVATAVPLNRMAIDLPAPDASTRGVFRVAGWAFEDGVSSPGIAGIDVSAVPTGGGAAIALGAATLGDLRPDVAAAFGAQHAATGFHLDVTGLATGSYDLRVVARSALTGTPNLTRTVRITVHGDPQPLLAIDLPSAGPLTSGNFIVAGWALAPETVSPPGIDAIDVWASPVDGGAWRFLGRATEGVARPDVGIAFGAQYDHAGYFLVVTDLPAGTWDLRVYPHAFGASAFAAEHIVRVTVPGGAPSRAITTGADAGAAPQVRRFSALDGTPAIGPLSSFLAFDPFFAGGVRVAEGDVNGDGVPDYIAGAGPGPAPQVRIYDGATGALRSTIVPFESTFRGGVFVAAGDVNGDGFVDVIVGAGEGRAAEVKVFSGRDNTLLKDFVALAPGFTGGVTVAAGDVNGDGFADIVAGSGPGAAEVRVYDGVDLSVIRSLQPYSGFGGGVWVASGDVNGDGFADIVTGAGPGGGPHVRVFNGQTGADLLGFFAFAPTFTGGVRVAVGDVTGDGRADIIAGAGPGGLPEVRVFDGANANELNRILAYAPGFAGGVFVATAVPVNRIAVDTPAAGASVSGPFQVAGWAYEENPRSAGVDAVQVWAFPVAGGPAVFLGTAAFGDARPDVAAAFGSQYGHAGFHLSAAAPPAGVYDLVAYVHSPLTGTFNLQRTVRVTIAP